MLSIPPVLARVSARTLFDAWNASRAAPAELIAQATHRLEAEYPGRSALLVDSGTSALAVALQLAGVQAGGIVALPAFACPDIATAAQAVRARVVLYDLEPNSLEPRLESIEACIQFGASIVVVCHFFGTIVDVSKVVAVCAAHDVAVVEDAAQHAGGSRAGIRAGALTDLGILSFGRGKGLSASGGGAVLWNPTRFSAPRSVAAASSSTSAVSWLVPLAEQRLSNPLLYGMMSMLPLGIGETRYAPPHDVREIDAFKAGLLLNALEIEPLALQERRAKAGRYRAELSATRGVRLAPVNGSKQEGALRVAALLERAPSPEAQRLGVVRSYPRGLWEYLELADTLIPQGDFDWGGARLLASSLWTLPTHWRVSAAIQDRIISELQAAV